MRKLLRSLLVFFTLALTLLTVLVAALALTPLDLQRESVEFTILPGSSLRGAAREISAAGVELDPWILLLLARLMRADGSIKAGSYAITRGITPVDLLKKLTRGDFTQAELAFIEGWTFGQLRRHLDAHPDLYERSHGAVRLAIRGGRVALASLDGPGFASGALPDFGAMAAL